VNNICEEKETSRGMNIPSTPQSLAPSENRLFLASNSDSSIPSLTNTTTS